MSYMRDNLLEQANPTLFSEIQRLYGLVPNFYRAQTVRQDLIVAQLQLFQAIVFQEGSLGRRNKEYIFLVCSAANLSTYCVTAHCEMMRMLGVQGPEPEQIAVDHTSTNLPLVTKALLSFAAKLNNEPTKFWEADIDELRTYGYSEDQILEAVLTVAATKFANFVAFGLGTVPDFDSSRLSFPLNAAPRGASSVL